MNIFLQSENVWLLMTLRCDPEKDDNTHAPIYDSLDDEHVVPNITEEFVRKQNIINVIWENNRSGWHKC